MLIRLVPALIAAILVAGCPRIIETIGPMGPTGDDSGIIVGRAKVVYKNYRGRQDVVTKGIGIHVLMIDPEAKEIERVYRAWTDEQGYFFIANVPINKAYSHGRVRLSGEDLGSDDEYSVSFGMLEGRRSMVMSWAFIFDEEGDMAIRIRPGDEMVYDWFANTHGDSEWAQIVDGEREEN